jgi:hypothetical protein
MAELIRFTKIADVSEQNGARGTQVHYYDDVTKKNIIVSGIDRAFDTGRPETMVFEGNEKGEVTDWYDLAVARGINDIDAALVAYASNFPE